MAFSRMTRTTCLLLGMLLSVSAASAQSLLINVDGRATTSLNGAWKAIVDPYEVGYYSYRYGVREDGFFVNRQPSDKSDLVEYSFAASDALLVPGDWNTQRDELFLYEGTVWYGQPFDYALPPERRLFVYVGAANYEARLFLNGEELGVHTGGFTPFAFEVTGRVQDRDNFIVAKVDNQRLREGVPTLNTDWWNYGGLTRRVLLVETPATFIRDYMLQLDPAAPDTVTGWVQLDGPEAQQQVVVAIPEAGVRHPVTTDATGRAAVRFAAPALERWSPEDPVLYDVHLQAESDTLREAIGFRTITTDGTDILLNGEPVFLRGISIHEEAPYGSGRAFSTEHARTLLGWAKDLGCNFVRLAHYPHNEQMVREADRMGLMVWSEIPVYWTIQWENPATYALAEQQLREMITRDKNRAAVVIWSVANETPRLEARLTFLTDLIDTARAMDPTRLISAATELTYDGTTLTVDDPLGEYLDVIGANEYLGWYGDRPENIPAYAWQTRYDKPLLVSEFGAGARYGVHGDAQTRWSEEYQAAVYRNQLDMLEDVDFLRGMSPWILVDFRSPRRLLPYIQNYWNRKGLLSEQGQKKQAFYVLQQYYEGME